MSSSASLPSPDNDYAAPLDAHLNKAFWDAALTSVGARIRALEAVKADWEELINTGTGQALAVIQANVEPQLVALTAIIDQLKADVASAEDAIAVINAGGVNMSNVAGLSAALALKANTSYVDAAIDALKGAAPAAYDTLVEIAAKLSEDDAAIAGLLTSIAAKANKATKLKVGAGLSLDGTTGSDEEPVEGDLSDDRLLGLNLASKAITPDLWNAGVDTIEAPISPAKLAGAVGALAGGAVPTGVVEFSASGNYTPSAGTKYILAVPVGGGGGAGGKRAGASYGGGGRGGYGGIGLAFAAVDDSETYPVVVGARGNGGSGAPGAGATAGSAGGTTGITIDGVTYGSTGGGGGSPGSTSDTTTGAAGAEGSANAACLVGGYVGGPLRVLSGIVYGTPGAGTDGSNKGYAGVIGHLSVVEFGS